LDRIDMHVEVPAVKFRDISSERPSEPSAKIRDRVIAARQRQHARFAGRAQVSCNARMTTRDLKQHCALDSASLELLKFSMSDMRLSARAYDRILKLARTIADLDASERITSDHLSEAVHFRALDRQLWA
jgi:magnesium chelatase family protein